MELMEAIRTRRSIRKFRDEPVPDEMIRELLEAARLAPSGSNLQPWRFVIVKSADTRQRLREATPYHFVLRAPVVFVCCADMRALGTRPQRIGELMEAGAFSGVEMDDPSSAKYGIREIDEAAARAYLELNVAIAIEHIVLRAVDLGLGSCWIGRFNEQRVKEILGLDEALHVVKLLPVGFPEGIPPQRPRFPIDDLVVKTD